MNLAKAAAIAAIMLFPAAAGAGPRDDLVGGMAKCGAVADNAARLACYDALNPVVRAAEAAPPPPTAVDQAWYDPFHVFGTSPSQQVRPEQFGAENLAPPPPPPGQPAAAESPEPEALESITAGVTDYSFTPYGKFIVILDNGQVWRQVDVGDAQLRFLKTGKNTVTISRGMLDSYNLVINDSSVIFKVKRVK